MTDWIEHNGGPQPVADDVWVEVQLRSGSIMSPSSALKYGSCWNHQKQGPLGRADIVEYRILNQHLIDAARLEGIRRGLEAAVAEVWNGSLGNRIDGWRAVESIRSLNPDTIAKEADNA